jgi:hypothetical protein
MAERTSPNEGPAAGHLALSALHDQLMYHDQAYFMSQLRDVDGRRFEVAPHHERWSRLIQDHARLVLLAPRGHGKSTLAQLDVLWLFYRHAHEPDGRPRSTPLGTWQAVLFSATLDQVRVHLERFRGLLAANPEIFGPIPAEPRSVDTYRARSSMSRVRLASGAELLGRSFGTATRGLHPGMVLLDDVVSDRNSGSERARDAMWDYFSGTILPMHAGRILIIGTAVHQGDLLLRLRPRRRGASGPSSLPGPRSAIFEFEWRIFRAIDPRTETALWPARRPYAELAAFRAEEPTIFSREYQNDPRDDAASLFPHDLTQPALDAGAELTFVPAYRPRADEVVLAGVDLAQSEVIGADWTVALVIAYQPETGVRRVLTVRRHRGLPFDQQIDLLIELADTYHIALGVVEQNNFQRWLLDGLKARASRPAYVGHTTGREKTSLSEGVPALKLPFLHGLWVMPSGDADSRRIAKLWQAELSAFGWRDGRLGGTSEHDDLVMATWFVERAIRLLEDSRRQPADEIIYGEDVGLGRVHISPDY